VKATPGRNLGGTEKNAKGTKTFDLGSSRVDHTPKKSKKNAPEGTPGKQLTSTRKKKNSHTKKKGTCGNHQGGLDFKGFVKKNAWKKRKTLPDTVKRSGQ